MIAEIKRPWLRRPLVAVVAVSIGLPLWLLLAVAAVVSALANASLDPSYRTVSPDDFALFTTTRAAALADPESIAPYIGRVRRMIALDKMARRYEGNNQPVEARAVFRQLAEEQAAADEAAAGAGK